MRYLLAIAMFLTSYAIALPLPTSGFDEISREINGNGTYSDEERATGDRRAQMFVRDINSMDRLAQKWNIAIGGMMQIAYRNLEQFEFYDEASDIKHQWSRHKKYLQRIVKAIEYDERAQQDLAGYWQWLDTTYLKIEGKLGYELCHALRLDDLYSLNRIEYVFKPCTIGESQWTCIFCGDKHVPIPVANPRRGDLPIISYWSTQVGCGIATFGAGTISFICGPLSMVVEYAVDSYLCPKLEPWLFSKACGG